MNGIIGLSQLALNRQTSPEIRDYLEKISSSSQSLLGILNDILDFSKLEAGRMSIENNPFDLDQVLDNLRNLFEERTEAKYLDFKIEIAEGTPRDLIGDALRIQQILSNLLGNAIKFSERGHVAIRVTVKQLEGSHAQLRFSVQDTGIGIAEDDLDKLFKPFSQVDGSITRRFGGTGLGLAISQSLLQLMGGEFSVVSQSGQGTSFNFDLNLGIAIHGKVRETRHRAKHEAGDLTHDLHEAGSSLQGARILIAEDNRINQQVVSEFLKLSGMETVIANNGQETLDLLGQHDFDAILMDVHMPVMGGVEATQEIRKNQKYADLPIIALTAGVTQEEREGCLTCGMNDFIAKPVNPESLITTLAKWVKPTLLSVIPSVLAPRDDWDQIADAMPEFDFATLKTMIGGRSELLISMLHSFLTDFAAEAPAIVSGINKGRIEAAEKQLHRLKGAAGSLGAKELHQACEELDAQLKKGSYTPESLSHWLKVFDETLVTLADTLTKWEEK